MRIVKRGDKTITSSSVNPKVHFIVRKTDELEILVELQKDGFVWRAAGNLTNVQHDDIFTAKDLAHELNTSLDEAKYHAFDKVHDFYLFVQRNLE